MGHRMTKGPVLSRRRFMELGIGLLGTLPSATGGFLLPFGPAVAQAAEDAPDSATNDASTHIVVVGPTQAGFVVADVAAHPHRPVSGALVTLTSRYNGQVVQGTTDADGKVVFDILPLAHETNTTGGKRKYAFNASLVVETAGYRDFATGILRVEGGSACSVPTQPLVAGMPYPHRVSLDEWDVLYTSNEFLSATTNDASHTLRAELAGVAQNVLVRLTSADGGHVYATTRTQAGSGDVAVAEFGGTFLKAGTANSLPVGGSFALMWDEGATTYHATLALDVVAPKGGVSDAASKEQVELSPYNGAHAFLMKFVIPKDIPIIGGTELRPWLPKLPVNVAVDPFGYLMVAFNMVPKNGYHMDDESSPRDGWKTHPSKSIMDQCTELSDEVNDLIKSSNDAAARKGLFQHARFSPKLDVSASLQCFMTLLWKDLKAKKRWEGYMGIQASLALNITLTENFLAGPFPFTVQFGFDFIASVGVYGDVYKDASADIFDLDAYTFDYTNSGVTIVMQLRPRLSVGVGISGVASVSITGIYTLTIFYNLVKPRFLLGMAIDVQIVAQCFLFSAAYPLFKKNKPDYLDSNRGDALADGLGREESFHALDGLSMAQMFDQFSIISDADLALTAEFERTGNGAVSHVVYVADGEPGQTNAAGVVSFVPVSTANGTTYDLTDGVPDELLVDLPSFSRTQREAIGGSWEVPNPCVLRLASNGGLVPDSDALIAQDVQSDPHLKVVRLRDFTYVFRIGTVLVNGKPRTRVIAEQVGDDTGEGTLVFDVPLGFVTPDETHEDYYDYDFDVCTEPYDKDHHVWVHLFLVSGRRPAADDSTIVQAASEQVFSYVKCDVTVDTCWAFAQSQAVLTKRAEDVGDHGHAYHTYVSPHVHLADIGFPQKVAVLTYLDRCGDKPSDVLSGDEGTHVALGMLVVAASNIMSLNDELDKKLGFVDSLCTQMACVPYVASEPYTAGGDHSWFQVSFRSRDSYAYYLVKLYRYWSLFAGVEVHACADVAQGLRVVPWTGRGGMLAALPDDEGSYTLYAALWSADNVPALNLGEQIGPTNVSITSFDIDPSGDFLYFPAQREGSDGYDYAADGTATMRDEVHDHCIMASRWFVDRFSDAFVFAEVKHAMDGITCLGDVGGGEALAFVTSQITDAEAGKANLWYTSMPHVRSATVVSCECTEKLVGSNTDATFRVALRNEGNVYLKGATVSLCEAGSSEAVSVAKVAFDASTLCESVWNRATENGVLGDVRPDCLLAPGKTSVYLVSLHIPDYWEGDTDVTMWASDAEEATEDDASNAHTAAASLAAASLASRLRAAVSALADDPGPSHEGAVLFTAGPQDDALDRLYVQTDYAVSSSSLSSAPVRVRQAGGGGKPGDDTSGGEDASGGTTPGGDVPSGGGASGGGETPGGGTPASPSSSSATPAQDTASPNAARSSQTTASSGSQTPRTADPSMGPLSVAALGAMGAALWKAGRMRHQDEDDA